jgi:hypothetical protein
MCLVLDTTPAKRKAQVQEELPAKKIARHLEDEISHTTSSQPDLYGNVKLTVIFNVGGSSGLDSAEYSPEAIISIQGQERRIDFSRVETKPPFKVTGQDKIPLRQDAMLILRMWKGCALVYGKQELLPCLLWSSHSDGLN